MKLTIEKLAPYLPYELKGKIVMKDGNLSGAMYVTLEMILASGMTKINKSEDNFQFKPILRNLSDLTKEIEHNGEKFVPCRKLSQLVGINSDMYLAMYINNMHALFIRFELNQLIMQKLFEWHFDVFSLIDKGLAIDINTLKS